MDRHRLHIGDIVDYCQQYTGPLFHAALMDAPYELAFMNKGWDNSGVAFRVEAWQAISRLLHPGAFMFVFGGSRTFHRMAVAIEDAGFVIHPTLVWLFSTGFPKATRIDTQVDRAAGAEREVVGPNPHARPSDGFYNDIYSGVKGHTSNITAPATPLAQQWAGHRYGLQALKPSAEFIICAQKPYADRPVDSITGTGAGALWIEGGRIPTGEVDLMANSVARWPPHVVLSHTPACTPDACADGCAVKALAEQSTTEPDFWTVAQAATVNPVTAARFFLNTDYLLERLEGAPPFMYTAKADRWQREAGLHNEPSDAKKWSGSPGHRGVGDYYPDGSKRKEIERRNIHSTVKPLALVRWLATLLLPPDAYAPRRLLVPFAGSGSEMIGALLAGWDHVQGVELETPYAAIAMQRLDFWQRFAGLDWDTAQEKARAWEAGAQADR